MNNTKYEPVIGLEVHVELKTASKMFCRCSADYFGKEPNSHTCPVCLGMPGALPVPNKKAIEWCILIGLALGCDIPLFSKFDRKNYFYPDLPKGYQISQYDQPFCLGGRITLSNGKTIGITRVHMEEDTGKLTHTKGASLIDFNRSGVPLVEIVTEPDFKSAEEVVEYLKKLQQIVRYLGVSNADMEKGDMRLEPNISLRSPSPSPSPSRGEEQKERVNLPNYKVEVKNINSFKFVDKAIQFELKRQAELLDKGEKPAQETRGFVEAKNATVSQRSKEEAHDYRYFPEPDIPPFRWTQQYIESLKKNLPKMPWDIEKNLINLGLSPYQAQVSTVTVERAEFVIDTIQSSIKQNIDPRGAINYVLNKRINDIGTITPSEVVEEYKEQTKVETVDEIELQTIIETVLSENEKAVVDYKNGKETVIMFLVGQVMRKAGKKIDAGMVKEKLKTSIQ